MTDKERVLKHLREDELKRLENAFFGTGKEESPLATDIKRAVTEIREARSEKYEFAAQQLKDAAEALRPTAWKLDACPAMTLDQIKAWLLKRAAALEAESTDAAMAEAKEGR